LLIIKPISYLVEWVYKVLYFYGMFQPQILTPARIKYVTLNRTFSRNKAIEELGYKPTVTIKVLNVYSFFHYLHTSYLYWCNSFIPETLTHFSNIWSRWFKDNSRIIHSVEDKGFS
jgi:hypothetical protein